MHTSMQTDTLPTAESAFAEGLAETLQRLALAAQPALAATDTELLGMTVKQLTAAIGDGHVCQTIERLADQSGMDSAALLNGLKRTGMVADAGDPPRPLVLDPQGRLYFYRYFDYERRLATAVALRSRLPSEPLCADVRALLDRLFAHNRAGLSAGEVDWQKIATALALKKRLAIISGGPGTGKTTTVINILACLLQQAPNLRIVLSAPTGKAAARMQEAIRGGSEAIPTELRQRLPTESHTLHRLLGVRPDSPHFVHHKGNPLALDVLVVDEASMLDLALAVKLFEALPDTARVILLGDKDQLAAVEAGAVFSELSACPALSADLREELAELGGVPAARIAAATAPLSSGLQDATIWLQRNYRFARQAAIGELARAILDGDSQRVLRVFDGSDGDQVRFQRDPQESALQPDAAEAILQGYRPYLDTVRQAASEPQAVLAAFDGFRVLCATRASRRGVNALNALISERVRAALGDGASPIRRSEHYPGRPIIITRNDYVAGLYNGDVGMILPDQDGHLMAWFAANPGRRAEAGAAAFRKIALPRLPPHETAFALTVHKAQGSEFERLALVLPGRETPLLTRELVYTAITRARRQVSLYGSETVLLAALGRRTIRHTGLLDRLGEVSF